MLTPIYKFNMFQKTILKSFNQSRHQSGLNSANDKKLFQNRLSQSLAAQDFFVY